MIRMSVIERTGHRVEARLENGRIHSKGRTYIPLEISSGEDGGGSGGLKGALVGGALLGGVGAIAGAVIGGTSSSIAFSVKTASGEEILCEAKKRDFPNISRLIRETVSNAPRAISAAAVQRDYYAHIAAAGYTFHKFILGPFYFIELGMIPQFIGAALLTVITGGLAWPLMPLWTTSAASEKAMKFQIEINATSTDQERSELLLKLA